VKAAPTRSAEPGSDTGWSDAWAAEGPPSPWREVLGPAAGRLCPDCDGPMYWTGAHTAVICPADGVWSVSPGALQRAAERQAAELERHHADTGRAVALTDAQARAERVRLRAWQDTLTRHTERLIVVCEPGGFDRPQYKRAAFEFAAILRGYLPEIRVADDDATLTEIAEEIETLRASPRFTELSQERDYAAARRDQEEQAAVRAAEEQRQLAELERDAERQAAELERAQLAERRAIEPPKTRAPGVVLPSTSAGNVMQGVGTLLALQQQRADRRKQGIAEHGACGFKHPWAANSGGVPAARLYGIQVQTRWGTAFRSDEHPSIRACSKHFDTAAEWMAQQGFPECVYWEL
jgi:hypothetical protein